MSDDYHSHMFRAAEEFANASVSEQERRIFAGAFGHLPDREADQIHAALCFFQPGRKSSLDELTRGLDPHEYSDFNEWLAGLSPDEREIVDQRLAA